MNMKKITSLALACILTASVLVGCSKSDSNSNSQDGQNNDPNANLSISFDLSQYFDENGYLIDLDTSKVKLPDYKAIVVPKEHHTPSKEDIQKAIDSDLARFAEPVNVTTGTVPDGATLNIDYVGSIDGVEFKGGNTNGQGTEVTIGVTEYIDDFLEQLVGKEIGSTFDIEVTFPEDYHMADLAGKDAVFKITINSMKTHGELPELTDDFVKTNFANTGAATKEEYIQYVTDTLSSTLVNRYLYNEILKKTTFDEINENAIKFHQDHVLSYCEMEAKAYGMTLDAYLEITGLGTREQFLEIGADAIKSDAEQLLVLQSIAKQENIVVTDEDVKEQVGENQEKLEELYGKNYVRMSVLHEKVLTFLEEQTPRA